MQKEDSRCFTKFLVQPNISSAKIFSGIAYGSGLHLLAYAESGELYTWGYNTYSQLGNGSTNHTLTPSLVGGALSGKLVTKVPDEDSTVLGVNHYNQLIYQVACGNHHCLALTDDGEVYAWGQNNAGQCGSGTTSGQSVPRRVTSCIGGHRVVSIACGQLTSMALLSDGEVNHE